MLHLERMLVWTVALGESVRAALRWASCHTGLPVVVVAATAIVASWHVFRRTLRFAVQVAVAAALLFAATRWGLLRW